MTCRSCLAIHLACCVQIRLLDFNPIGGATSPLLFAWEELGYHVSQPPNANESAAASTSVPTPDSGTQQNEAGTVQNAAASGNVHDGLGTVVQSSASQEHSFGTAPGDGPQRAERVGNTKSSNGHTNGNGAEHAEIMVRFADPGSSMLRPALALYGAPYDMADLSEGGAIADMLRRMQTQEQDPRDQT